VSTLQTLAEDAQRYRYSEIEQLLPSLSVDERTLALRLALLPAIDLNQSEIYHDVLFDSIDRKLIYILHFKKVLVGDGFPTYGHQTRHAADRGAIQLCQRLIENGP
jgi:hypothetical protein